MVVGIDIAKLKFDAMLLIEGDKKKHKTFSNDQKGFKEFHQWLIDVS